ncbi:MAG: hypothetical protein JWP81_2996 [Ferruginibacter sp.]|nr:hypothetical protein [Ferruginibacter sp.]
MKDIIKLSILFVTMSVLTSSRENVGAKKSCTSSIAEQACLHSKNDYAINITCAKKTSVVQKKEEESSVTRSADLEVPISPISRFILLQ